MHGTWMSVLLCVVGATLTAGFPGARRAGGWLPAILLASLTGVIALAVGFLWPWRAATWEGQLLGTVIGAILLLVILLPLLAGLRRTHAGRGSLGPTVLLTVVGLSMSVGVLRSLDLEGVAREIEGVWLAVLLLGLLYWLLRRVLPGPLRMQTERLRPGSVILVGLLLAGLAGVVSYRLHNRLPHDSEAFRALRIYLLLLCVPALEYATLPEGAPWLRPATRALALGLLSVALLTSITSGTYLD